MKSIASVLVALVALTAVGRAQTDAPPPASITGYVYDPFGGGIDHVTVFLISTGYSVERYTTTDQTGHFAFEDLPGGEYILNASIDFVRMTQVSVHAGETATRDLTVTFETVHGTLVVCAECATIGGGDHVPQSIADELERDRETQPVTAAQPTGGWAWYQSTLVYPDDLADKGIEGSVVVTGRVGIAGFATDVRASAGADRRLQKAAIAAVTNMPWEPARIRSLAFEVPFEIEVEYTLRDRHAARTSASASETAR